MRHSVSRSLASISLLLVALSATAATRPHYGGTLRIEMRAAPASLDPTANQAFDARVISLLFENLVRLDETGAPQPQLARGWQSSNNLRWQFPLRPGVKLHDGSLLTPAQVAASLKTANPDWRITVADDAVVLEFDAPRPHLPAELALPRNAIVVRTDSGLLLGTGAFRLIDWQPGRRAVLAANDDYWGGRPFVDAVDIAMGRSYRDQLLDLDLSRADVIELAPDQVRRAMQDGRRVEMSSPVVLMALRMPPGRAATQDLRLREAISLSLDRKSINDALLQHEGEAVGGMLPQWLTGYAFLFPVSADIARAKELRPVDATPVTLAFDSSDPLERLLAERVAVNARDAGVVVQAVIASRTVTPDAYISRVRLDSADGAVALAEIAGPDGKGILGATAPEALYAAEAELRGKFLIVPLVYLPDAYVIGSRVRNWAEPRPGGWPFSDIWLEVAEPQRAAP